MSDEESVRKIVIEVPSGLSLPYEEIEPLIPKFKSLLIDTKSERLVIQAKPEEKAKEIPQIVQVKEVAVPKEQLQSI